jgi:SAM-dependent methyltransferase
LNDHLRLETEKLARSWAQHEPDWLRDYLVAGVEDPRLNQQSILSRHFLIRALANDRFNALVQHEYHFAAVTDWLLRVTHQLVDPEELGVILFALRKGSDNAEGLEIPRFVSRTFAVLPTQVGGLAIPNYIEAFLTRTEPAEDPSILSNLLLNTFCAIWNAALSAEIPQPISGAGPVRFSLLEPACGSANDYRFLHRYGLARFFDYTGFDLCHKNIENARALFPGVRFHQANVFEIAAPSKSFDFCIVHDLFEHLSLAGLEQAVQEVCRVTRRGLCLGFFQMDEISDHIVRPLEDYHWNLLSRARMAELCASNGFAAHPVHIGALLQHQIGCLQTHNPYACTFFLRPP